MMDYTIIQLISLMDKYINITTGTYDNYFYFARDLYLARLKDLGKMIYSYGNHLEMVDYDYYRRPTQWQYQ